MSERPVPRARRIVKLAASERSSAQQWLRLDERGTWERVAGELLEKSKGRAAALGMDEPTVDKAIATELVILALQTLIKAGHKKGARP